jgi:hypothetical protein
MHKKDMKTKSRAILLYLAMVGATVSVVAEKSKMSSRIPAELVDLTGEKVYLEDLDNPEFHHHDPSSIIKYKGLFYCWYTEHTLNTNGWDGYITWSTSPDGLNWSKHGIAIPRGESGAIDDKAAITAYVVPHDGKYYLFYTAYGSPDKYKGITYAVAETPDGPWTKSGKTILWPSGDMSEWDGTHNDDTNIIFFKNKWFLYYKGKPSVDGKIGSPSKTVIGVATSDNLLGPYEKHASNPVFPGHALTTWVHRDGVGAFGYGTFWSEDGFNFVKTSDWSPGTVGLYCPDNFGNGVNNQGVSWGMVVMKPKGKARHISRLEVPLNIEPENNR